MARRDVDGITPFCLSGGCGGAFGRWPDGYRRPRAGTKVGTKAGVAPARGGVWQVDWRQHRLSLTAAGECVMLGTTTRGYKHPSLKRGPTGQCYQHLPEQRYVVIRNESKAGCYQHPAFLFVGSTEAPPSAAQVKPAARSGACRADLDGRCRWWDRAGATKKPIASPRIGDPVGNGPVKLWVATTVNAGCRRRCAGKYGITVAFVRHIWRAAAALT